MHICAAEGPYTSGGKRAHLQHRRAAPSDFDDNYILYSYRDNYKRLPWDERATVEKNSERAELARIKRNRYRRRGKAQVAS